MRTALLLFLGLNFLFSGCILEESKEYISERIIIASDYLNSSDTTLFISFAKTNKLSIEIRSMTTDQLIGTLRKDRYDSDIDVVMMRSLYDINRLNKIGAFQEVAEGTEFSDYNVYPLLFDPYLIICPTDTVIPSNISYEKLMDFKGYCLLDHENYVTLLSNWYIDQDPVVSSAEVHEFSRKIPNLKSAKHPDSVDFILTSKYDLTEIMKDTLYDSFIHLIQPINAENRIFNNSFTIGILNQSNDYVASNKFIKHCLSSRENELLSKHLNIISLSAKNEYNLMPNQHSLQFYTQVERSIK